MKPYTLAMGRTDLLADMKRTEQVMNDEFARIDPFQDALPCFQRKELHCDMERDCRNPITHIGSKGYVYCAVHAVTRRQSGHERTRRMTASEIRQLKSGEPLADY